MAAFRSIAFWRFLFSDAYVMAGSIDLLYPKRRQAQRHKHNTRIESWLQLIMTRTLPSEQDKICPCEESFTEAFQWRIQGGGDRGDHPPLNFSRYWKPMQSVRDRDRSPPPLGMWMTSHGQCPRGVCACECPRVGVFFIFPEGGWRHADNVQGGGVLWQVLFFLAC